MGRPAVNVPKVINTLNWAILPVACTMIGFCYLDRSNIAYMQLQLKLPPPEGLGFSDIVYGQGSGFFFISYSLFQIPSNIVLTFVGAPLWLTIIVTLWGFCAMSLVFMRSASDFLILRFLLGLLEAGTFPGIWYHMSLFYPVEQMTLPLSATKAAVMVAQVLSSPVAAVLMSMDGAWGLQGWRWLCLVEGAATVVAGLCVRVFLPRTPGHIKGLSTDEQAWIRTSVSEPPTFQQLRRGLQWAATSASVWHLTAVAWTKACAGYALLFWTPIVIADLLEGSTNPNLPILLTSIPYTLAAVSTYAIGWSSQVRKERRLHTAIPFFIGGVVLLLAPVLAGPRAAVPAFLAICAALSLSNATGPLAASLLAVSPDVAQPSVLALWNSGANIGGYVGPALFGVLKKRTGGHAAGLSVMGLLLIFGAGLMVIFDEQSAIAQRLEEERVADDKRFIVSLGSSSTPQKEGVRVGKDAPSYSRPRAAMLDSSEGK